MQNECLVSVLHPPCLYKWAYASSMVEQSLLESKIHSVQGIYELLWRTSITAGKYLGPVPQLLRCRWQLANHISPSLTAPPPVAFALPGSRMLCTAEFPPRQSTTWVTRALPFHQLSNWVINAFHQLLNWVPFGDGLYDQREKPHLVYLRMGARPG